MNDFAIYLPDGGTAEAWGIAVTGCGLTRVGPGLPYPPQPGQHPASHLFGLPKGGRILECYQLLYISAGSGSFESTATGLLEIKAGAAFLLFPDVWHRYGPNPATGWTEHFVEMTGPTLERLREQGVIQPRDAVFTPGEELRVIEAFDLLQRLAQEGKPGNREQIATLGIHLLATVIHPNDDPAQSDEDRAVRHAETRMREDLGKCLPMSDLAEELGVPYDRFRHRFKALTGLAPKQYYRKLQMRRAEEILLYTGRTVSDIAEELGFDSAFHFSAAFKEHTGQAPAHWRKSRVESASR